MRPCLEQLETRESPSGLEPLSAFSGLLTTTSTSTPAAVAAPAPYFDKTQILDALFVGLLLHKLEGGGQRAPGVEAIAIGGSEVIVNGHGS